MLARIRQFAKSWVALILIGLLIISFAVFQGNDVLQSSGGNWVVKAGDRTITGPEFRQMFDNYKEQAQQQSGQTFTNAEAVERGFHVRMLEELATSEAFVAAMAKMGVRPSDKLVLDRIREARIFFDPVSGRFDQASYERQLAENNLTPERFEGYLRDEIAELHYGSGLVSGLRAPRIYAAAAQVFESEARDLSLVLVHPGLVGEVPQPTDAQLTTFLQENAANFRRPEFRALTIVRFQPSAQAAQAPVDPAEVQRRYEFRRDSLSTPERRTLVQVPARNAQAAAQAAQRLRAGQDPAAVAQSLGVEVVRFDNAPASAIPDRRVAEAAFRLQPGQVSDPIQGQLGFSVVQVTAVTPGQVVTLEQARPEIEAQIRSEAAVEQVTEVINRYEDAHAGGATLVEAARTANVPALSIAPIAQSGRDERGQPVQIEPQILQAAFEQPVGGESDIIDLGQGRYAAVRVDRIIPSAVPTLAAVRDQLVQVWQVREIQRRMQTRADALAAQARGGAALQTVAQQASAPFTRFEGMQRSADDSAVPPQVAAAAFGVKQGEIFTAPNPQGGVIVGRVDAIRFPPAPQAAASVEPRRQGLSLDLINQLGQSARNAARQLMKARTNPDLAREALGVTAEDQPAEAPEAAR